MAMNSTVTSQLIGNTCTSVSSVGDFGKIVKTYRIRVPQIPTREMMAGEIEFPYPLIAPARISRIVWIKHGYSSIPAVQAV